MSKTGDKPEKSGELNDFGGRESSMEKHKGPATEGAKGRAWHGSKKSAC